jgi:hypothetical protein
LGDEVELGRHVALTYGGREKVTACYILVGKHEGKITSLLIYDAV